MTITDPIMDMNQYHPSAANVRNAENFYYGYWKIPMGSDRLSICPKLMSILGANQTAKLRFREIFSYIDAAYISELKGWIRNARKGNIMEPIEFKILTPQQENKWLKMTGLHYSRNWKSPEMVFGMIEDITQNVREERIALAIVNHELRNPLAVMKLNAQLLEKSNLSNCEFSPSALAAVIVRSIDGITSLLNQYMSGDGNKHGNHQLNSSVFNLCHLVDQTLTDFRALHPDYTFIRKSETECTVKADKFQITQVLVNYLTNAVKFSPGKSTISVIVNSGTNNIEVSVCDQGIGIPAGQEERIFERFCKLGDHAERSDSSRGLGLYLVKKIIESHKGNVWVQKAKTNGSAFFFSLPGIKNMVTSKFTI